MSELESGIYFKNQCAEKKTKLENSIACQRERGFGQLVTGQREKSSMYADDKR